MVSSDLKKYLPNTIMILSFPQKKGVNKNKLKTTTYHTGSMSTEPIWASLQTIYHFQDHLKSTFVDVHGVFPLLSVAPRRAWACTFPAPNDKNRTRARNGMWKGLLKGHYIYILYIYV